MRVIERYVYLPGTFLVLAILDGNDQLKELYTHGPDISGTLGGAGGIGGLLSQRTFDGSTSNIYYHPNAQGSTTLLTDQNGREITTYSYSSFGQRTDQTQDTTARYLYNSKEFDPQTELYYYGYRYYNPRLNKWLTRDPLGEAGGINLTAFCANDPVNHVDPLGLELIEIQNPRLLGLIPVPTGSYSYYSGTTFMDTGYAQVHNAMSFFYNTIYGGTKEAFAAADAVDQFSYNNFGATFDDVEAFCYANGFPDPGDALFASLAFMVRMNKGYKTADKIADVIDNLDDVRMCDNLGVDKSSKSGVETLIDDAAFWSGRSGENRKLADMSGLTTLEMTPAGQALDAQDLFSKMSYDEAIIPWENLSREFASEASGTVNAWVGGAYPLSVWSRIEKPTLLLNPKVKKIIIHDATRPELKRIIYK
ncbi:MAG: hypothetical protein EOM20_06650 [Spartobacteria bacterium]|nr:hypothetical protein [Spartobacteria bacterium]